jgi:hypothetical protein
MHNNRTKFNVLRIRFSGSVASNFLARQVPVFRPVPDRALQPVPDLVP